MLTNQQKKEYLNDPFEEQDIEWRVQMSGISSNGKPWAMVIPYITNRAIQQRLDDVFGFDGWRNEYRETIDGKGFLCGISFKTESGDWITKWDGAEYSNIESLKGALSGSMKRAAVQLGIGRYLYNLKEEFAVCQNVSSRFEVEEPWTYFAVKDKKNKNAPAVPAKWLPPALPEWAIPNFKSEQYLSRVDKCNSLEELRTIYSEAMQYAKSFLKHDFAKKVKNLVEIRAEAIKTNLEQSASGKASRMLEWTQGRINNLIHEATNESVIKQAKIKIHNEIKAKCKDIEIKPDVYLTLVDNACKERISTINQNQNKKG